MVQKRKGKKIKSVILDHQVSVSCLREVGYKDIIYA